jgi:hypothetical protein
MEATVLARSHATRVEYDYDFDAKFPDKWGPPPGPRLLRALLGQNVFAHVTCMVGDPEDLHDLTHLPRLQKLYFSHRAMTDGDLRHLLCLKELREVSWSPIDARITNRGIEVLAQIETLETLGLCCSFGSPVTPEGLRPLLRLPRLKRLDLRCCPVDDSFVPVLSEFTKLESISVAVTKISNKGEKDLKKALPNVMFNP